MSKNGNPIIPYHNLKVFQWNDIVKELMKYEEEDWDHLYDLDGVIGLRFIETGGYGTEIINYLTGTNSGDTILVNVDNERVSDTQ